MAVNLFETSTPDPYAATLASGGLDARKRRLLAAQLLQKQASTDEKVFTPAHGNMKLLAAMLGGAMEGYEDSKAAKANKAAAAALMGAPGAGGATAGGTPSLSPSAPSPSVPSIGGAGKAVSISNPELAAAIKKHASAAGLDPIDVATAYSYETAGTFDPWKAGPTTKWGQHRGLIQWGEPQRRQYGVDETTPVERQVEASIKYLQDRGVKPGHGLMEIYSAINAGGVGPEYQGRSDAAAGGAPGTVADKVNNQMAGHRKKAEALFAGLGASQPVQVASADPNFVPPGDHPLPPERPADLAASAPPAPQPNPGWQDIQATPEEFAAQLVQAQGGSAGLSVAPAVPPPPPESAPMPPERPPETYAPRAPQVPPQALAAALAGGPGIDPNSNDAGAREFATSGMGHDPQALAMAVRGPVAAQDATPAPIPPPPRPMPPQPAQGPQNGPPGMYGGGAPSGASPPSASAASPQAAPQPAPAPQADPQAQRLMQVAFDPYVDPQIRSYALKRLEAMNTPKLRDVAPGATVIDDRTGKPVFRNDPRPEPRVIGKDQFGNEIYGTYNPQTQKWEPSNVGQQPGAPATDTQGKPIPPGVDPKVVREAQSKDYAAGTVPPDPKFVASVRREIQEIPSYKNLSQAAPVYKSMSEAAGRDTRAADVNMIYGLARIMDPASVVRESEMTIAQAVATLPQQLRQTIESQLTATGRLSQDVRAQIMQEAHSRVSSYQQMFDQDASMYRGIAQRSRINEADVIPSFGPFKPFEPAGAGQTTTPTPEQARQELERRRRERR